MSNGKRLKILDILYVLLLFIFFLLILFYPDYVQFYESTAVFVKCKASYSCIFLGFIFFMINTHIAISFIKKKLGCYNIKSSKQMSVKKKHPKKMRKDNLIIIVTYLVTTSFFIVFSFLSRVYSRYELSNEEITEYNFINKMIASYELSEFTDFEIGTLVYTGKGGTTRRFYIKTKGPINIKFMKSKNRNDVLCLMKKLKYNYKVYVERKEYKSFMNNSEIDYWSQEEKNMIKEIFE